MSYKDAFFKANIQGIIALMVIVFGFGLIWFGTVTQTDKNQIYMLMVMVLSYYFGSSSVKPKQEETLNTK